MPGGRKRRLLEIHPSEQTQKDQPRRPGLAFAMREIVYATFLGATRALTRALRRAL